MVSGSANLTGKLLGGCFNPAVAIGIDVSTYSSGFPVSWSPPYMLFEFIGSALAAGVYRALRTQKTLPLQKYAAEFLGTFILVLTVAIGGNAWSIAASLMCMIFALGSLSGANFNPAVSLSILITRR